jgi:hypothetical protein
MCHFYSMNFFKKLLYLFRLVSFNILYQYNYLWIRKIPWNNGLWPKQTCNHGGWPHGWKTQVISAIWSHSQKDNKFEKILKYGERPCLNRKRNKQVRYIGGKRARPVLNYLVPNFCGHILRSTISSKRDLPGIPRGTML